jgi:5-methylthioadenosine/S-adenosylhomocysteine deaminase
MRLIVEPAWTAGPDGGVREGASILIEDGRIVAVDRRGAMADTDAETRLDGTNALALPGLVNAHQHGRPDSTLAMGIPDAPLECWLVTLLSLPAPDPYADTRRLCRRLLQAGVTTAVHSHYSGAITPEAFESELRAVLSGYRDGGVRGIVAADLRDRGQPVYGDDGSFTRSLPADLRERASSLTHPVAPIDSLLEVVAGLRSEVRSGKLGDVELIYGPPGPPWCSSGLLERVARADGPVHMHLHETWYEREFGVRDYGHGTVAELARIGLLNQRLSVAHGVWLDERECATLGEAGVSLVTNPSSNLRLHAGIAPIRTLLEAGVNVALGTDNMALGGGEDLLAELRLLDALHRRPGIDEAGFPAATRLQIASASGGRAVGRPDIGVIQPGACGDIVLVDLNDRSQSRSGADLLDGALATARAGDLKAVVAGGRLAARDGEAVSTSPPARDPDAAGLAAELLPYVKAHYKAWAGPPA